MITAVLIVLALIFVVRVLVSRWFGQPVNVRRLLVLPAVLSAVGLLQVIGAAGHGLRLIDVGLILVGVAISILLGAARGATVTVSIHNGEPWLRYRPVTLALWGATVIVRLALAAVSAVVGAQAAARGPAILLSVGITLLAEGAVVAQRAFSGDSVQWHARGRRHPVALR